MLIPPLSRKSDQREHGAVCEVKTGSSKELCDCEPFLTHAWRVGISCPYVLAHLMERSDRAFNIVSIVRGQHGALPAALGGLVPRDDCV